MISIVIALIGIFGLLMKNNWVILLSAIGFLYLLFPVLPTGLKIILAFVLFLWILNMGKGK